MKAGKKEPHVVHDDDAIVVADKPAGLLTIGTDRERHRTLYRQLFDSERRRRPVDAIVLIFPSEDQHGISITVEPVFFANSLTVDIKELIRRVLLLILKECSNQKQE